MAADPSRESGTPPKSLEGRGVGPQIEKFLRGKLIKLREAEFSLSAEMQVLG